MKHPNEAFIDLNIRSKLINLAELERQIGMKPNTLYNKIHLGRGKALTIGELIEIENIIKTDLGL